MMKIAALAEAARAAAPVQTLRVTSPRINLLSLKGFRSIDGLASRGDVSVVGLVAGYLVLSAVIT